MWEFRSPAPRDRRSLPSDWSYPYFASQVEGIKPKYDRLSAGGMEFVASLVDFVTPPAVNCRNPFGNLIEIYEIREGSAPKIPRPQ